jgi:hypothetical protein
VRGLAQYDFDIMISSAWTLSLCCADCCYCRRRRDRMKQSTKRYSLSLTGCAGPGKDVTEMKDFGVRTRKDGQYCNVASVK